MKKLYALTGGPGVGKTTTLNLLMEKGIPVLEEIARGLILEQQELNAGWQRTDDPEWFRSAVIRRQIEAELEATDGTVIDGCILDNLVYAEMDGVEIPDELKVIMQNTEYEAIFFLGRLGTYSKDGQRIEDEAMAEKISRSLWDLYSNSSRNLISFPPTGPLERAELIGGYIANDIEHVIRRI